jgi:hypothetical protein
MSAATYNLTIDQGSDFAVEFQISEDGVPRNLTGYFARSQVRKLKTSSDVAVNFTCTITAPLEGKMVMSLDNTATSMVAGDYHYDMELYTLEDASVTRMIEGKVTVTQEVTR